MIKPLVSALVLLLTAPPVFGQLFDLYVSDAGGFSNPPWQILRFDGDGSNPTVFIDNDNELAWPQDILFLEEDGVVLVSNLNSGRITRYDASTGVFIDDFANGLAGPTRMKIGPGGILYVLQWNAPGTVRLFDLDGTDLGTFGTVGVLQSIGLDWDAAGNLYVSSFSGASVRRFDPSGADLGLFIDSNLVGPTNIWFDESGDLLVSDYSGTAVKRFDSTGTYLGDFLSPLSQSEGVDFLPNGDILIGNGADSTVKRFDSSGVFLEDLVASGSGGLLRPNAVVLRDLSMIFSDGFETGDLTLWSGSSP